MIDIPRNYAAQSGGPDYPDTKTQEQRDLENEERGRNKGLEEAAQCVVTHAVAADDPWIDRFADELVVKLTALKREIT